MTLKLCVEHGALTISFFLDEVERKMKGGSFKMANQHRKDIQT